ncbi:MAG: phosphoribosylformylglycinamidine synthase [Candidatus Aenigmarchaeota archaeon]|nr:phosphoribosylformylglycinamidine synthase [Candidatus Aenigmarchaeota archaeon]
MAAKTIVPSSNSFLPSTIQIGVKPNQLDPIGDETKKRIEKMYSLSPEDVRVVDKFTLDLGLSEEIVRELADARFVDNIVNETTTNTPFMSQQEYDWAIEVGFKPGVKDNSGDAAKSTIESHLEREIDDGKVYASRTYLLKGKGLSESDARRIVGVLANDQVQEFKIMPYSEYERDGAAPWLPKTEADHKPEVNYFDIINMSDDELIEISQDRSLALNLIEMQELQNYLQKPEVISARKLVGLSEEMSDVELEKQAQGWSEHCTHKIFNAKITYNDTTADQVEEIDSIFNTYIREPTRKIQDEKKWIVSTLSDNAGVIEFAPGWYFAYKVETHNSPSNVEPYGGAITGIVGVFRDPMGTGQGGKVCMGTYQFSTGFPDYAGEFMPGIPPMQLLSEVIRGVKDGGNKSGVPTVIGGARFHDGHMGKCAIHVGSGSTMPADVNGKGGAYKKAEVGDRIVMVGGLIGKDGIHGATESSLEHGGWISAQHVQIGDPYTQKKVQDFIIEARDLGLYNSITDNGAGGLSSSVGEMAEETGKNGGCVLNLDYAPLKYDGMDPWEVLVSESQERMTLAVSDENMNKLFELAKKHDVVMTDIGEFNDAGYFDVKWEDKTIAYLEMDFMNNGVPQMELEAEWIPSELIEPKIVNSLSEVVDENTIFMGDTFHADMLKAILLDPNVVSMEYIQRQFDHEVQGTSVGPKHFVGKDSDVEGDAVAFAPVLEINNGIIASQAINPELSEIDTYDMTKYVIDEAIRKIIAVGGDIDDIVLCGNFCHPSPIYDENNNPDGKYKAAQLVRSVKALEECCLGFGTADITGKDSMSMDGRLKDEDGNEIRVSAPPTLLVSGIGIIDDVSRCITMDAKMAGDSVYVLGVTSDELGASEFYRSFGFLGKNAPKVDIDTAKETYRAVSSATKEQLLASAHGVCEGGLAVALSKVAFAGGFGMDVDLSCVSNDIAGEEYVWDTKILNSKSASRLIVTVAPEDCGRFENILKERGVVYGDVGRVTDNNTFHVKGVSGKTIMNEDIYSLKGAYKGTFGGF